MCYNKNDLPVKIKNTLEDLSMKKESIDNNILAHTSWNCKYHIVFAPKLYNLFNSYKLVFTFPKKYGIMKKISKMDRE